MTDNLYDTLGVDKDAEPDAIKKAYRKLAKSHHPDAGGDPAQFHALAKAYDVLSDDDKRKRYDETGRVDDRVGSLDERALSIIGGLVDELAAKLISEDGLEHLDLVAEMRNNVAKQILQTKENRKEAERFERKATKLRKRFKAKKGPDYIGLMLDNNIDKCREAIHAAAGHIELLERAKAILDDAEFAVEPRPAPTNMTASQYQDMARRMNSTMGSAAFFKF